MSFQPSAFSIQLSQERTEHRFTSLVRCPQCPFVFFYRGRKIGVFRKVWRNTCARLGLGRSVCFHCGNPTVAAKKCAPCSKLGKKDTQRYQGLLFHELRRTGVPNLVRAGVSERRHLGA